MRQAQGAAGVFMALAAVAAASAGVVELYTEIPGVREFNGQLIVRPIQAVQNGDLRVAGPEALARDDAARAMIAEYAILEYVPQTDEYVIEVGIGLENEVSQRLMASGNYQYAEPNWTVYPIGCPNDSRFGSQWHHGASKLESCAAWDLWTGTPTTTVGICDTGVRTTHEDLLLNRREGYNAVNRLWESNGGQINDINGHGTATTGCAAANGNNGRGVSGLGWNLSHRMLRVSNDSGGGSSLSTLQHAARTSIEAGDKVANVSYSGVDSNSNLTTATYIKSIGGLLVWAAGNEGRNLTLSSRDNDDLIVVGATNSADSKPSWSNFGVMVDVVAPGDNVYTTCASSNTCYGGASGTSFSAPLTTGLIGLLWDKNLSMTPDTVEDILKQGVDDLGTSGPDNTYGYGRINAFQSLSLVGGGGDICDRVRKHNFRCRSNGALKGKVIFNDNSFNGQTITVTIDGSIQLQVVVNGDRAPYNICCYAAGNHTASLTSPNCPDFNKSASCP